MSTETTRLQIEDLQRRYIHCIDNATFDDWPEFFTEECIYKIIPRRSYEQGHPVGFYFCDSNAMLRDRVLCLRETAIFEPQYYRHMISGTIILEETDDGYVAETNLIVIRTSSEGEMMVFAAGKYRDTLQINNGQALFKEKLVILDSTRVDMLLAMPL